MPVKQKTVFVCQQCGYESPKWAGQCICGAWNTMIEEKIQEAAEDDKRRRSPQGGQAARPKPSRAAEISPADYVRLDTGIGELNRVLGGGLVKGSLTLVSGEPGIGKSTIILQAAANIASRYGQVLYVSGEESIEQIKMRADRVCCELPDGLFLLSETNMENISAIADELCPVFIVIDSIQTMYTASLDSAQGSVSQVRACGNELMRMGKTNDLPVFIACHVTKSGELAGPKIVEHLVDCVLNFTGERNHELRILRAFKNRFGTTSEIGAFEMAEGGLVEIEDLSKTFLEGMESGMEGSVATAVYEGTRPLLLEVQALASPANIGFARRSAIGVELSRLNMVLAVLDRKAGISLVNHDVYVNIVGGLRPEGTSTDLAVAIAVHSAFKGTPCPGKTIALGEIGLTGELRSIQNADKIAREAAKMGFEKIILPYKNAAKLENTAIKLVGARNVREAISEYLDKSGFL
ncbi:MAG: DNA repair protein RadA [Clostridiales bacterium]|nr:DNA repair protein RadA [Clostridiales bacterium]